MKGERCLFELPLTLWLIGNLLLVFIIWGFFIFFSTEIWLIILKLRWDFFLFFFWSLVNIRKKKELLLCIEFFFLLTRLSTLCCKSFDLEKNWVSSYLGLLPSSLSLWRLCWQFIWSHWQRSELWTDISAFV